MAARLLFSANCTTYERGQIYESPNANSYIGRCTLCNGGMCVVGRTKSVGTERGRTCIAGLQPISAWDCPVQYKFRASQGSSGGRLHRTSSARTVAQRKTPHYNRTTANPCQLRIRTAK